MADEVVKRLSVIVLLSVGPPSVPDVPFFSPDSPPFVLGLSVRCVVVVAETTFVQSHAHDAQSTPASLVHPASWSSHHGSPLFSHVILIQSQAQTPSLRAQALLYYRLIIFSPSHPAPLISPLSRTRRRTHVIRKKLSFHPQPSNPSTFCSRTRPSFFVFRLSHACHWTRRSLYTLPGFFPYFYLYLRLLDTLFCSFISVRPLPVVAFFFVRLT